MRAFRLDPNTLRVPMRAEADDGTVGDALVVLRRGEPGFDDWEPWAEDVDEVAGGDPLRDDAS